MGEIYLRMARFRHADIAFSTAIQLQGLNSLWWVRCGYARKMAKDYRHALEAYNKALELSPNQQDAARGKERVMNHSDGYRHLRARLQAEPDRDRVAAHALPSRFEADLAHVISSERELSDDRDDSPGKPQQKSLIRKIPILCVVNTCTVTGKAEQKARRLIRLLLKKYPKAPVLVTGCYAEVERDTIAATSARHVSPLAQGELA
jgi:tetratricopeptide (TPR) repeat protein